MDSIVDLGLTSGLTSTFGLAALLLALGVVAIAALPWRAVQVRDMVQAYDHLSTLSGGFARTRMQALRRGVARLGQLGRPFGRRGGALTRTLS